MVDLLPPLEMTTQERPPLVHVPVAADPDGHPCPIEFRDRVMIDVVHDGASIPEAYLGPSIDRSQLSKTFFDERDWGAAFIAGQLASALHLDGYHRIETARALLDFNRFPGITPPFADHMGRFAINAPFSTTLGHEQKRRLLRDHYDVISSGMERVLPNKLLKVSIHTYDERNVTQTRRPAVSILSRAHGHSKVHEIPGGLFDPLFPSELAELTCDRMLRSRIALTLEEAAVHVADNYPYSLPEGSMEIRSQVWYFFRHLRAHYDAAYPLPDDDDPYSPRNLVWNMLLDTNLRSTESDLLRGYLHMFRLPPHRRQQRFESARDEYERVAAFLTKHHDELVVKYRSSVDRPSSLVIEVRKDLVFDVDGRTPVGPRRDDATGIARLIAKAIREYLLTDRAERAAALATRNPRWI